MTKAHLIGGAGFLIAAIALLAAGPASVASPAGLDEATGAPPGNWPQWRGPNRDAVSVERGLLNEWQAGTPRVLWRIPVGEGFSSISVWQGRLYTLWDEGESEYLVSLDAVTGKELWRHRVDTSFTNSWGNGPRSTPAVDGEVVYAVSARGKLHAVTAQGGRAIWSHDLAAEYGGTIPAVLPLLGSQSAWLGGVAGARQVSHRAAITFPTG